VEVGLSRAIHPLESWIGVWSRGMRSPQVSLPRTLKHRLTRFSSLAPWW
jgi:hypothetical protein